MWTVNFQMFKLDLEKAKEPEIRLPTSIGSLKKQERSRKAPAAAAKSFQSCLILCDPIYSSTPGSSVHRILQARILEWVAISFSLEKHLFFFIDIHFPGGSDGKASAYNAGDPGWIPGSGRSPGEGNGNPLQYSCLENPMGGGTW